jgi:beta-lactamase class A
MHRILVIAFPLLIATLTVPVRAVPATAGKDGYDVSYLWCRGVAGVLEYRERVARVLGPAVAKDLKVVADAGLYGLLYQRDGDSAGATRVARAHSKVLRRKGLEAAAPIRSRDWIFVDGEDAADKEPAVGDAQATADATEVSEVATTPDRQQTPAESGAPEIHDLENAVEEYIKRLRREGRIAADERTGWSVYDFTTGKKLVTINEDVQFQAASLIKPFVAAAFFHRVERGELTYGGRSRWHMRRMIQHSNNASTNWVMRQVGGPRAVQRLLDRHYGGIFRQTSIVEYIPANGRTYRNKASAHDYSRFLYALWKGGIPGAREIKRLMYLPGPDRIYTGVQEIPSSTKVYNKTGSTARLCGDMGILSVEGRDGRRYPYTLIGIIEKPNRAPNYTAWIRSRADVIRDVSGIVYRGIAKRHDIEEVM